MTRLSDFKRSVIADKTSVEAGYVDHPLDLGKATNHGITYATSREWESLWEKYGWDGDMKTMPIDLAYEIYDRGWWQKMLLDSVATHSEELAEKLFDFGINAGRGNAVRSLQRILNVSNRGGVLYDNIVADGGMGRLTMTALAGFLDSNKADGEDKIAYLLSAMQVYHYLDISEKRKNEENEAFTRGWFNRTWRDAKLFFGRVLA